MPLTLSEDEELELELELAKASSQQQQAQGSFEDELASRRATPSENLQTVGPKGEEKFASEMVPGSSFAKHEDPYGRTEPRNPLSPHKSLAGGLWNFGRETVKTIANTAEVINEGVDNIENPYLRGAAKVATTLGSPLGRLVPSGTTEAIDKAIPKVVPEEGTSEELMMPATQIAAGVVLGTKGADKVVKGITALPNIAKYAGSFLGAEATTVAGMDKDTTPDIINTQYGPAGVTINPDDTPATVQAKKTLNLAADAVLVGTLAGTAGKIAGWGIEYGMSVAKRIKDYRNLDTIQKEFVGTILERAAKLPENATREETLAAYQEIADYMQQNSEVLISFGKAGPADIIEHQDSISVLISRLDPADKADAAVIQELESLRSSALSGGSPSLETNLKAPKQVLDQSLKDLEEMKGGTDAIDQTKDALVETGRREIDEVKAPIRQTQEALESAEGGADQILRTDSTFGPKLREAEQSGVKLDLDKASIDKQTEIVTNAKDARAVDVKARNDAYKVVADLNAEADMHGFKTAYNEVREQLPEVIQKDIDRMIAGSDGSFAYLNNVVRPRLSQKITDLYGQSDGVTAGDVRKVRDNITTDQVTYLTEQGNEQTIKAAKDATKAHKEYSDKWSDGLGGDLKNNEKKFSPKNSPIKFNEGGRATVINAIKDPNRRESVQQLRDILNTEQGKRSAHLIDDVIFAEAAKGPIAKIASTKGKISDVELDELVKPLQEMAGSMSGTGRERIETLLTTLRDRKWDVDKLKTDLKGFEDQAKIAEEKILDDYLGDFVKKNSDGSYDALPNGYAAFKKLLKDPQSGSKLENIITKAGDDPNARKGLEAAWAKAAGEALQNSKDVPELDEQFVKYGKQIFKDDPIVVDAITALNQRAITISNANKTRQAKGLPISQNQVQATGAVNQVITWMFGVLNPTAARIRTVSGDLMKQYDSKDVAKVAADVILSDAKEFSRIAQGMIDKKRADLSPQEKKMLFRMFVNVGVYGNGDEEAFMAAEDPLTDQTNTAFKK